MAPSESMDGIWLSGTFNSEAFLGQKSIVTWVIEATEFKFEVICYLQYHLEITLAPEATKMALRGNIILIAG